MKPLQNRPLSPFAYRLAKKSFVNQKKKRQRAMIRQLRSERRYQRVRCVRESKSFQLPMAIPKFCFGSDADCFDTITGASKPCLIRLGNLNMTAASRCERAATRNGIVSSFNAFTPQGQSHFHDAVLPRNVESRDFLGDLQPKNRSLLPAG